REDEGQSPDAGSLENLLDGGGIESPCGIARAHPGRKRHGSEDVRRAVDGLEGDVAAERLAGQHDPSIAELLLRGNLLQRALHAAGEGTSRHRLREVVALEDEDVPGARLEQPERRGRGGAPQRVRARDAVVPDDDAVRTLGPAHREIAKRPLDPEETATRLLSAT